MTAAASIGLRWLIEIGWQVTLLVALVLLAEAVLGRVLTPRWRHALWLLVVLRLAVPWSPEVDGGLLRWRVDSVERPYPAWVGPPAGRRPAPPGPVDPDDPVGAPAPAPRRTSSPAATPPPPARPPERARVPVDPTLALAALWLLGVLAVLGRDAAREFRFRRRLRRAAPARDSAVLRLVDAARVAVGLRRPVETLETDLVAAPAVCGLVRPRLLLPVGIAATLPPEALRPVVLHELFHLRHRDVPANLVLAVLRAVHWFHPMAHLAIRRLRDARESARDWEALGCADDRSAREYAETLIRLAARPSPSSPAAALGVGPRHRDLERRILMITAYPRLSRRTRLAAAAGVALLAGLGWITFTQAAPPGVLESLPAGGDARELARIECEREAAAPAWHDQAERRLDAPVTVDLRDASLADAIDFVRAAAELDVVVDEDVVGELGDLSLTLIADAVRLRDLLDLLGRAADGDLGFTVADGVLVIGHPDELPYAVDVRFYRLEPLLRGVPSEHRDDRVSEVIALTTGFTTERYEWDQPGVSIDTWNGLLVVAQTDAMHRRIESFLNLLLNRGRRADDARPAWRVALERRLETPVTIDLDGVPIREVLADLQARHRIPIVAPRDVEAALTLSLSDVPLRAALGWIARSVGLRVGLEHGGVVLAETVRPRLEIHEVGDLVAPLEAGDEEDHRDQLQDMILSHVDPPSWDEDPLYTVAPAGEDLLVVRQSEAAHARIRSMFAAMRRALGRDG